MSQKINLIGSDHHSTTEIFGNEVDIYPSPNSSVDCERVLASNKIKLSPAVKFYWEYQYYTGELICRHSFKPLIAYCINSKCDDEGTAENSMIRIRDMKTSNKLLLKCFTGRVVTMTFAFRVEPVLAVLDQSQTLYCFKITINENNPDSLEAETLLVLQPHTAASRTNHQTLAWCPWKTGSPRPPMVSTAELSLSLPEDPSMLLGVSYESKVELIDVSISAHLLRERYPELTPSGDQMQGSKITENFGWTREQLMEVLSERSKTHLAYAQADNHSNFITVVTISCDASCCATAGVDGKVYIYSLLNSHDLDRHAMPPIHVFSPHDGAPLFGLIFIDHGRPDGSRCTWSHLLTGASFNRELRLWSSTNWHCEQTIRFCPAAVSPATSVSQTPNTKPSIIMALDQTSSLLVASDIRRRVLYILELTDALDVERPLISTADCKFNIGLRFSSISEFILTTPCILFALGTLQRNMLPDSNSAFHSPKETLGTELVTLEIHTIHTWHLLNGTIIFSLPRRLKPKKTKSDSNFLNDLSTSPEIKVLQSHPDLRVSTSISADMSVSELSELTDVTFRPVSNTPEVLLDRMDINCSPLQNVQGDDLLIETTDIDESNMTPLRPSDFSKTPVSSVHLLTNFPDQKPDGEQLSTAVSSTVQDVNEADGIVQSTNTQSLSINECNEELGSPVSAVEQPVSSELLQKDSHDLILLTECDTNTRTNALESSDSSEACSSSDSTVPANKMSSKHEVGSHSDSLDVPNVKESSAEGCLKYNPLHDFNEFENDKSQAVLRLENKWMDEPVSLVQRTPVSPSNSSSPEREHTKNTFELNPPFVDRPSVLRSSMTEQPAKSMESLEQMVHLLLIDGRDRSQQMTSLTDKLSDVQSQLNQLSLLHSELVKRLELLQQSGIPTPVVSCSDNHHGYVSESEMYEASSTSHRKPPYTSGLASPMSRPRQNVSSGDGNSTPEWAQQILLQLRSQQGDFARRCTHLEAMINKVTSISNDINQSYRRQQNRSASPTKSDTRLAQVSKLTCDLIRPVLRSEMQNAFVNNASRLVEPMQKSMTLVIQDCLKPLPSALADNVSRLLREKHFTAQLARAASSAVATDLANAYRDSLQRVFVPALEKNIHRLFEELNVLFKTGTNNYLQQVGQLTQPIRDSTALANSVTAKLIPEIQNLLNCWAMEESSKNTGVVKESMVTKPMESTKMNSSIRQPNRTPDNDKSYAGSSKAINLQFPSEVVQSASGRAPAPNLHEASTTDLKEALVRPLGQAQKLIQQDKLVEALELALISTNQDLVLDVCNDINPEQLFGSGHYSIAQNILLSLIHQMSCGDLSVALELKLRYLQEAVLSLDKNDPTTIEHGPRIIGLLTRRLQNFLNNAANTPKVTTSLRSRILKLQRAAKWIFDSTPKTNN